MQLIMLLELALNWRSSMYPSYSPSESYICRQSTMMKGGILMPGDFMQTKQYHLDLSVQLPT